MLWGIAASPVRPRPPGVPPGRVEAVGAEDQVLVPASTLEPAGNRRFLGVWRAPAAPNTIPEDGGRGPPPFGMVVGLAGAAQAPDIDDFRPAQQNNKNQNVALLCFAFRRGPGRCWAL